MIGQMPTLANPPLPEGTQLESYRILRMLAAGGFSFVYLAHDANQAPVAIKEYRIAEDDPVKFNHGMRCFFEEGRALARLSHPNVVRVLNFFRANDTVYLVMRYERGRSLQEHVRRRRGTLEEAWLRSTFAELLNGLREVHSNKLMHLDIKPANVYIRNDGTPLLIDFGAARQTLSGEGIQLPPTYTPGFASPEQHTRRELLGPWSDVYSVGATLYACLAGTAPQPALQRLERDELTPARRAWSGKYSAELLDIVDWCMRLDHLERPQSVLSLQKALLGEKEPEYRGKPTMLHGIKDAVLRFTGTFF
ncbi:MAG TPA: serine/threonine-protein kinase [Burkholderiales bacterium]